jgi:hypothetical protein
MGSPVPAFNIRKAKDNLTHHRLTLKDAAVGFNDQAAEEDSNSDPVTVHRA